MIGWHGVCSVVASLLGGKPRERQRASGALAAKRLFFAEYFFFMPQRFCFFFFVRLILE